MATLEVFLSVDSFKNYANGIERIEDDFIASNYERFLWRETLTEFACMRETSKKAVGYTHIPSRYISDFMTQFQYDGIIFLFPERYDAKHLIIQEVCKKARLVKVLENIFPEDDSVNQIAVFEKSDANEIALMNHLVYDGYLSDVYGGYKLFGHSLAYYSEFCADGEQMYVLERPNDIMHFMNYQTRRDTNPFIIYEVRKQTEYIVQQYYQSEFDFYLDLNYTLLPFLQKLYCAGVAAASTSYDWKSERNRIRSELAASGKINSKWKNELSLYQLVKKEYPDALYQYRPSWLSPQSIDIFIPQLNTAIEYQGLQHYQAVDFFGGENAFKHRTKLDEKKARLCKANGVRLIAWNYNTNISKQSLVRALEESIRY